MNKYKAHRAGYKLAVMHFREMMLCGWTLKEIWKAFKPTLFTENYAEIKHSSSASLKKK